MTTEPERNLHYYRPLSSNGLFELLNNPTVSEKILFHISYAHVSIMPRIFSTVVFPPSGQVLSSQSLDRQRISTAVSLSG
jgi:hypothetical protein